MTPRWAIALVVKRLPAMQHETVIKNKHFTRAEFVKKLKIFTLQQGVENIYFGDGFRPQRLSDFCMSFDDIGTQVLNEYLPAPCADDRLEPCLYARQLATTIEVVFPL